MLTNNSGFTLSKFSVRLAKLALVGVAGLVGNGVAAARFEAGLDNAKWESEGSMFECRMSQMLPQYGQAVFYRRAGEKQQFFLDTKSVFFKAGKGSLMITGPIWKPRAAVQDLGYIPVSQSKRPVKLGAKLSERIMAELNQGQQVVITRKPWYGARESLSVAFNSMNYRPVFSTYMDCVAGLLPVNFDQVEKTTLLFRGSGETLAGRQKVELDSVVVYAKADDQVSSYYIDGHTDSRGIQAENLELSKKRAQMVADYLIKSGLDSSKVIIRWHGERYPVTTNRTAKGRAQNRRVTVRLERGEKMMEEVASR